MASFGMGLAFIFLTGGFTTNREAALFGTILDVTRLDLAVVAAMTHRHRDDASMQDPRERMTRFPVPRGL